ncbi:ImmA/IrrE family metallo-endopeptidase [Sphingobium ummariense]
MKLESSLSSRTGSPLNRIVDLRHPEERMAARLVERLQITPPVDVKALCEKFADLVFKNFPIDIDGLCLDLKVPGRRPKVWVSKNIPPVRQRFTLAHEIGHIIIPWHRGTIIDDIDAPRTEDRGRYRKMEAEANRFAAELLMPSSWVIALSERSDHAAGLMHSIHEIAQVSFPAAFLKTARLGRPGFVGAEVRNGTVIRSLRTPETHSKPPEPNTQIEDVKMPAAYEPSVLNGTDSWYYWWKIRDSIADPGIELVDWRQILEEILMEIPPEFRHKSRQSVNAIIGWAIGREPRGSQVDRIYKQGIEAAQNRESESQWVRNVILHPRFNDYILARARERASTG